MSEPTWVYADAAAEVDRFRDAWAVFEASGRIEIERDDLIGHFTDDGDAVAYVHARASMGCMDAREALYRVALQDQLAKLPDDSFPREHERNSRVLAVRAKQLAASVLTGVSRRYLINQANEVNKALAGRGCPPPRATVDEKGRLVSAAGTTSESDAIVRIVVPAEIAHYAYDVRKQETGGSELQVETHSCQERALGHPFLEFEEDDGTELNALPEGVSLNWI